MNTLSSEEFYYGTGEESEVDNVSNITMTENPLPILKSKVEIIEAVKNNQFVIIHGQTGCGKTTQVPQYLFKETLHENGAIGITQPRRIAAVSMAKRVSKEMQETLGKTVGYEIRFDKKCGSSTKIKYMTDGILLNECVMDKKLRDYSIIMIDEAHERSLMTDVLLGILKKIAIKRPELKVIISSATICVEKFVHYFGNAKVISVESRLYPVEVFYHNITTDYIVKTVEIVQQIHRQEMQSKEQGNMDKGDILVFLTGQEEIYDCCEALASIEDVVSKPLYGAIDFEAQKEVFDQVKPFETKVVVATNIAETSITIEGIKYVIDCGYVKQNNYNARRSMEVLEDVRISKAQAEQRKGRAGRTQSGICHRLYHKSTYDKFKDEGVPEIFRKNLSEIYLRIKSFGECPKEFVFLDPPAKEELDRSEKELMDLGLITCNGDLTSMGTKISELPVDPILGKVLLTSLNYQCTLDVIRIVAMFSEKIQNIFRRPRKKERMADEKKNKFHDPGGDHFTLLNVYNKWIEQKNRRRWCHENFIDANTMERVEKVIKQIRNILERHKLLIDRGANNFNRDGIKKSFVAGYFRNICVRQPRDVYCRAIDSEIFSIYGSSSLKNSRPKIILFHNPIKSTRSFASGVMELGEEFLRSNIKNELALINFPEDVDRPTTF